MVERWILHKLQIATNEVNKQLEERNFMAATSVIYSFWLYELCDVFIVRARILLTFDPRAADSRRTSVFCRRQSSP